MTGAATTGAVVTSTSMAGAGSMGVFGASQVAALSLASAPALTAPVVGGGFFAGLGGMVAANPFQAASFGMSAIGFGVQMMGSANSHAALMQQHQMQQQIIARNALIAEQDKQTEIQNEEMRQRLISEEGSRTEGDVRVAQAGLGQVVDRGSALDITDELATDIAMRKAFSARESELRQRSIDIKKSSLQIESSSIGMLSEAEGRAQTFRQAGTALTAASTLSSRFRFNNGSIGFRT